MIYPRRWLWKRPGLILPVFFLCLIPVSGQVFSGEADGSSWGNTFVARHGHANACQNQAGLGWIRNPSITLQHTRPFCLKELGVSSLSAQCKTGNGSCGAIFSTAGIKGFRQTSAWISYGMLLGQAFTAGIGIHYWHTSINDYFFFHPGISCALGIQVKINDDLMAGAHILHPIGWFNSNSGKINEEMAIAVGLSYTFFHNMTYSLDVKAHPEKSIQFCHSIALQIKNQVQFFIGLQHEPFSISGGMDLNYHQLVLHLSFSHFTGIGISPTSSISHVF